MCNKHIVERCGEDSRDRERYRCPYDGAMANIWNFGCGHPSHFPSVKTTKSE